MTGSWATAMISAVGCRRWWKGRGSEAGGSGGAGGLPAEHALAFAMGTHGRLGADADAHCSVLAAEPGLVGMIVWM